MSWQSISPILVAELAIELFALLHFSRINFIEGLDNFVVGSLRLDF